MDDDEIQDVIDDEDDVVVDTVVVDGVVLVLVAVAVEGNEGAVEMDDEDAAADGEDKDSADPDYSYYQQTLAAYQVQGEDCVNTNAEDVDDKNDEDNDCLT